MKKHKILNMRNMAIAFLALVILLVASVFVLNRKINSLYDATVQLENAANTKMSVFEIKNDEGNSVLTLMISPEGSVTAIGGGDADMGSKCAEFINEHGNRVDKWYLNGEDDKGAYDYCVSQGISVSETYIISGIEKLEQ